MQFICWMAEAGLNLRTWSAVTMLLSRIIATIFVLQCSELSRSNGDTVERDSYFNGVKTDLSEYCHEANDCQKNTADSNKPICWGYEPDCNRKDRWYRQPVCNDEKGWQYFASVEEKIQQFWKEADFGFVKNLKDGMMEICKPRKDSEHKGSFVCSEHLTYCKASNLYMDLRDDGRSLDVRLKESPFSDEQLGGNCDVDQSRLQGHEQHRMQLTSWVNEVEKFSSLSFDPFKDDHCDIIVEKPTFFMKLDAVVNMYHHFCDFFNLYITQHVNGTYFGTDVNIVLWENSPRRGLGNFGAAWKAFTQNPVLYLGHEYGNKRVCFKQAIFALLPRMVFGLFYNTPLIPGCSKSGMFKAFCDQVLSRLGIKQERRSEDVDKPVRVTLLSRKTKFRQILNEKELVHALQTYSKAAFRIAEYTWDMPFLEQLKITHNSDVFIGMHGAGLAHALFLPDWALLFELYNCGDTNCYRDLARLRGVDYLTWINQDKVIEKTKELHPQYKDHAKFRNYAFDVTEFMRLVDKAVAIVKKNLEKLQTR